MVKDLQDEAICRHRPLHGQPELLLDGDFVVLRCYGFSLHGLAHERRLDEGIDGAESIHLGQFVRGDKADLELFVLLFYLGWHHHELVGVLKGIVFA